MDGELTVVPAAEVRARIAAHIAGPHRAGRLGAIELQAHQLDARRRIEVAIREFGGALLADETGLGKTYSALDIASRYRHPLVVAPAGLRDMWCAAAQAAGVSIAFASLESLSRTRDGRAHSSAFDLVIVDEAHHLRNPATARYRAAAELTRNAKVLLLTATPVHNSTADLAYLLALFVGARAFTLDPAWTSRCVIRRGAGDAPSARIPIVEPPLTLAVDHDEGILDAILALPPPVPPRDGGDGGALLMYSLLRQWASSQGALVESLRRRVARAAAILAALDAGLHPTRDELTAWSFADGAVQLAFPELIVCHDGDVRPDMQLAPCVEAHIAAVRSLLDEIRQRPDPDVQRAAHLTALRARHPGQGIVAFTQYADTVSAMHRLMRAQPAVAALTADGGIIAGGTITRRDTLARFAPRAQGVSRPGRAHRIECLLTTDLLSEGVNLQDASVVVHLDLPWTPARLEQRVGRVARIGSLHARVAVYTMLPPASSERIVRAEERLREKLQAASRTVGVIGTILPSLIANPLAAAPGIPGAKHPADLSPVRAREEILALIQAWRAPAAHRFDCARVDGSDAPRAGNSRSAHANGSPEHGSFPVASIAAPLNGFVALVAGATQPRLIADTGDGPTDHPVTVLTALRAAGGPMTRTDERTARRAAGGSETDVNERTLLHASGEDEPGTDARTARRAMEEISRWLATARLRTDLSLDGALQARSRRSVVDRIAAITRRAPRHLRPSITALAAAARQTAVTRYGAGAERVLGELAEASMPDEAWLRAVSTFGALHGAHPAPRTVPDPAILALILLRRVAAEPSET